MAIPVSVVVPVYNAARTLADCLRALEQQSLSKSDFEVIVVDDMSTDSSVQVAKSFDVHLLKEEKHRGAAAGRNVGIRVAQGDWIAFTDADCIPSRNWLKYLVESVTRPDQSGKALGAAGRILGYESNSAAARFVDLTGGNDTERHLGHPNFPFAPAGNVMYRGDALQNVGGFDERYYAYDCCDLHYRLLQTQRGPFYFEPRAIVFHRHRTNWIDYWRQQFWHGQGLGQFMLHHKDGTHWSLSRELTSCRNLGRLAIDACSTGNDDDVLVRHGSLVRELAQHLGFISTYWNILERMRW
jgi:glycosyltransferase involved in cell wall biosynthesis